jgi:hypothetical protein
MLKTWLKMDEGAGAFAGPSLRLKKAGVSFRWTKAATFNGAVLRHGAGPHAGGFGSGRASTAATFSVLAPKIGGATCGKISVTRLRRGRDFPCLLVQSGRQFSLD